MLSSISCCSAVSGKTPLTHPHTHTHICQCVDPNCLSELPGSLLDPSWYSWHSSADSEGREGALVGRLCNRFASFYLVRAGKQLSSAKRVWNLLWHFPFLVPLSLCQAQRDLAQTLVVHRVKQAEHIGSREIPPPPRSGSYLGWKGLKAMNHNLLRFVSPDRGEARLVFVFVQLGKGHI